MVTIIDSDKPKPSKFNYDKWVKDKPADSASRLEKDKFWEREKERWVNGHGGLLGVHYAYLTIGSLKVIGGQIIRPRYRDFDEWVLREGEDAKKKGQHEIIVKRREFGLSSIHGGFLPVFNAIMNPGSTALMTSADKGRVEALFADKTLNMYFGLDNHIRPGRVSQRQGGYLHMGVADKATGKIGGIDSKIKCRETADSDNNAKAFESERAMYIFLDELFRHDRADMVLKSSLACMTQGMSTIGHMVLGGSCGEMTQKGAEVGKRLWNDARELNMKTIFIPGYACIESADELDDQGYPTGKKLNFCVNGHTDQAQATEWILKTRERLKKAKDQSFLQTFIVQWPLTIEEVFDANSNSLLGEHILTKLKQSEVRIKNQEFAEGIYDLKREGGIIRAYPNKATGKFHILNHPKEGGEYIGGCDPIPFGTAAIDKGSDYAAVIKNRIEERYVAYYAERNLNSDQVTENNILLQEYYKSQRFPNGALMNPEMNRGAVLLEKYKAAGKLYLLCDRLIHLGIAYESKHAVKGWYNNEKTGQRANEFFIAYLTKYGDNVGLQRIIDEARKWPNANLDVIDAVISCEMLDQELTEAYKVVYKPAIRQKRRVITRNPITGKTEENWV